MIVERADFVSVPVTDLERSTRFYAETVGFEQIGHSAWPESQLGEKDPDGNVLMLHRRHTP